MTPIQTIQSGLSDRIHKATFDGKLEAVAALNELREFAEPYFKTLTDREERNRVVGCCYCGDEITRVQDISMPPAECERIIKLCTEHDANCERNPLRAKLHASKSQVTQFMELNASRDQTAEALLNKLHAAEAAGAEMRAAMMNFNHDAVDRTIGRPGDTDCQIAFDPHGSSDNDFAVLGSRLTDIKQWSHDIAGLFEETLNKTTLGTGWHSPEEWNSLKSEQFKLESKIDLLNADIAEAEALDNEAQHGAGEVLRQLAHEKTRADQYTEDNKNLMVALAEARKDSERLEKLVWLIEKGSDVRCSVYEGKIDWSMVDGALAFLKAAAKGGQQ